MTTILVIEDEPAIRENLVELLTLMQYQALAAENGAVGVELAFQYKPDLIICDVMMPELDGYGVLHTLRSDVNMASIPFIFLTAITDRASMRKGMEIGADDYLTKPFSISDLQTAIETRLQRHAEFVREHEQRLEDLRGNIVHMLPHELRTPLSAILGFSDLLLSDPQIQDMAEPHEMIGRINIAAQRLHHLVENFLLYAQIELLKPNAERLIDDFTPYPKVLIEDQALYEAEHAERQQDLCMNIIDVDQVQISPDSLKKIVSELVDNACKFSKKGTQIRVESVVSDGIYSLYVSDQGRGMTGKQIQEIGAYMQFERKLHEQQGTGLGLCIARGLAELYQGRLEIESVPTQYTTVRVLLPLRQDGNSIG